MARQTGFQRIGRGTLRRAEYWIAGSAAAFILVFAVAAGAAGRQSVLDHLARLGPGMVIGLLALSLANYAARGLRWLTFSRQLGMRVPVWANCCYFLAGFAMTVTPGKVGEALRLWLLYRGHDYRVERTASLLVGDRLSDACALLLLSLAGLGQFSGYGVSAAISAAAILAMTFFLLRPRPLIEVLGYIYGRLNRGRHLFARVRMALRRIERLASWPVFGGTLLLAVVGWTCEAMAFHWILHVFGADISPSQAVFIFAFGMLLGGMVLLPGGLGGTEATMVALLLALGVKLDIAIAATALVRATTLWFAVALGCLALPPALRMADRNARHRLDRPVPGYA